MVDRRRFLRRALAASAATALPALAGCSRGRDYPDRLQGPVAEPYETATAIGGDERRPDRLRSKAGVDYHEAVGEARCANCRFYVPDRNDDGLGACTLVEGYVEPDGYCTVYAAVRDG